MVAYATLAAFTFWLYAFGPALTLLRDELHFSYTVLGLYSVLWSGGAALAGAGFAVAARHLPRRALLWGSALATVAGAALFTLGSGITPTLAGAVVLGVAGTTLLAVVQAVLSDRHGARRDLALSEANVGAAACAVTAPLALGALAGSPAGWRAAFALPALALVALYLRYRGLPLTATPRPRDDRGTPPPPPRSGRLPPAARLFAALTAVGIAVEFCLVYFGTEVLVGTGLSTAAAATALSSNYLGLLVGRLAGAVLTRRPGRTVPLLHVSMAVTAAGFLLFWLSDHPAPAVLGLFVCGTGIANLYPLSVALTLGAAPGREDPANARTQLLGGLVTAAAPFLLGSLADAHGLTVAFTLEPVLIGAGILLLLTGLRARDRPAGGPPPP
ncbi:MFS transporter [Geodermatophilus saharensis]|uniref:MFS transporter n=1 Tax=Geodermatophilus saharensis TaxID=1137994 RepID=UPI0015963A52|nr:MFS transporter [Geodermatophilus saharensis]